MVVPTQKPSSPHQQLALLRFDLVLQQNEKFEIMADINERFG